jgi:predicted nucleic acid-binding protein
VASFVLDASALVKAFAANEEHAAAFTDWLHEARLDGADVLAPHLLRYELGQWLTRHAARQTPPTRKRILDEACLGVRFAEGQTAEVLAPPLTYYDASYLSLAQATGATLVSYDDKLLLASRKAKTPVLSPGVA